MSRGIQLGTAVGEPRTILHWTLKGHGGDAMREILPIRLGRHPVVRHQSPEFRRQLAPRLRTRPMLALLTALSLSAAFGLPDVAHAAPHCDSSHSPNLSDLLNFKGPLHDGLPQGWGANPPETVTLNTEVTHNGQSAIQIKRNTKSPLQFSNVGSCVQADFSGTTIELRGFLRTNDVSNSPGNFAGLWLREDGDTTGLAIDNMFNRHLVGTTGWTEYAIKLPVKPNLRRIVFGALLDGTGTLWVSGLQLLVDSMSIQESPKQALVKTVLDTDHQFDHGSDISIKKLTRSQIENLVTLGKVWGFLKYYDPAVTSGQWQWDYELFRIMPTVLTAPDRDTANAVILNWIKKLGPVSQCNSCSRTDTTGLALSPDLGWIDSRQQLGDALSAKLREIRTSKRTNGQFYVSLTPGVENPIFQHELAYPEIKFPDSGFQLLALYRFWNVIEYWYPDRQGMGENWDHVLAEFIPKLGLAKDFNSYQLQMMALIAMVHDTHANLWSSINVRPPVGDCHLPVRLRFIQDQAVVTAYMDGVQASTSPIKIGDIVTELDGKPVSALVKDWSSYYTDSNEAARLRDIAGFMTRGPCGQATVGIRWNHHTQNYEVQRVPVSNGDLAPGTHDLPGPAFRLLSPEIAYLKLSTAKPNEIADDIERARGTKGLIIDVRNYPLIKGQDLASHLINHSTPFVRYTAADLEDPGAFQWTPPDVLTPEQPYYTGKIVILVDAITQSHAEYVSMMLRAAPEAMVVGSTTAGADGNVSKLKLPGGLYTFVSGIGVYYPDKKPTQRVGIVPNVVVTPTIAGIRAGQDQILEKAVRLILGPNVPESEIQKICRPSSEN